MKHFSRVFILSLTLFPSLVVSVWAQTEHLKEVKEARREFESRCPKPQWWDRVSVSDVTINTYDDLLEYWQDKNRSESQFSKAAYRAILNYPLDSDIVVNAINLMNNTYSYSHRTELQEYAIERYFSYKSPYGKSGNIIASIVRNTGQLYNDASRFDKSVALIERLLKEREAEINDHLLELIHLTYAEALYRQDRTTEAINVLKTAVKTYNGSWEKRLNETIVRYEGSATTSSQSTSSNVYVSKEEKPWWTNNFVIIGGGIVGFLFVLVLRGSSKQRLRQPGMYPQHGQGTDSDVQNLVMRGNKISAIKLYREIHNLGLKESKQAIDQIARRLGKA